MVNAASVGDSKNNSSKETNSHESKSNNNKFHPGPRKFTKKIPYNSTNNNSQFMRSNNSAKRFNMAPNNTEDPSYFMCDYIHINTDKANRAASANKTNAITNGYSSMSDSSGNAVDDNNNDYHFSRSSFSNSIENNNHLRKNTGNNNNDLNEYQKNSHHNEKTISRNNNSNTGFTVNDTPKIGVPMIYEFELPQDTVGLFIGRQGRNINWIERKSGAMIMLRKHPAVVNYQICSIEGTEHQIDRALDTIAGRFQELDLTQVNIPDVPTIMNNEVFPAPDITQLSLPGENVMVEVSISSMVSAGHIFVQQPTHGTFTSLEHLNYCMNMCYSADDKIVPQLPRPIETGVICACPLGSNWYRAQVVAVFHNEDACDIRYMDYGGYSHVKASMLRQVRSDFMTLPFQAVECYLANIDHLPNQTEFSQEALVLLGQLTKKQVLQSRTTTYAEDGTPYVELFRFSQDGTSLIQINREMATRGVVAWRPPTSATVTNDGSNLHDLNVTNGNNKNISNGAVMNDSAVTAVYAPTGEWNVISPSPSPKQIDSSGGSEANSGISSPASDFSHRIQGGIGLANGVNVFPSNGGTLTPEHRQQSNFQQHIQTSPYQTPMIVSPMTTPPTVIGTEGRQIKGGPVIATHPFHPTAVNFTLPDGSQSTATAIHPFSTAAPQFAPAAQVPQFIPLTTAAILNPQNGILQPVYVQPQPGFPLIQPQHHTPVNDSTSPPIAVVPGDCNEVTPPTNTDNVIVGLHSHAATSGVSTTTNATLATSSQQTHLITMAALPNGGNIGSGVMPQHKTLVPVYSDPAIIAYSSIPVDGGSFVSGQVVQQQPPQVNFNEEGKVSIMAEDGTRKNDVTADVSPASSASSSKEEAKVPALKGD